MPHSNTLRATITNKAGICTYLPDSVDLVRVTANQWHGRTCGATNGTDINLGCAVIDPDNPDCTTDFTLALLGDVSASINPNSGCSCNPLSLVFDASFLVGSARFIITPS